MTAPRALRRAVELGCKKLAKADCDVRDERCQERLFELASCVSERRGTRPPLRFVSDEASRHERLKRGAQVDSARAALERATRVLGLGEAFGSSALGDAALESTGPSRQVSGVGANAYYAPRERVVFFVTSAATAYAGDRAALTVVHEYVHAIQDLDGQLLAVLNARDTTSFDQELTAWSAFEGEATLDEEIVRAWIHEPNSQTNLLQDFAARTSGSDSAIGRQRRPLEASFATFPYTYGAYWATLETEPPASTYQILARRHDWPPSGSQRCEDQSPPRLAWNYPRRARDTLGAWIIQAYVRRNARDPERARSAARRWRGDWLSIYSRAPTSSPSIIWQTCWDSPHAALEMRELIGAQLRDSAGDRASVTKDAHRVTATVRAEDLGE